MTSWATRSFIVGAVLCVVECLATYLASTHKMTVALHLVVTPKMSPDTALDEKHCASWTLTPPAYPSERTPQRPGLDHLLSPSTYDSDPNHSVFIYQIPCIQRLLGPLSVANPQTTQTLSKLDKSPSPFPYLPGPFPKSCLRPTSAECLNDSNPLLTSPFASGLASRLLSTCLPA